MKIFLPGITLASLLILTGWQTSGGGSSSGSATPSGPAGGDLSGTYPNPTVTASHIASGGAAFTAPVTMTVSSGTPLSITSNEAASVIFLNKMYAPNALSGANIIDDIGIGGSFNSMRRGIHYVSSADPGNFYFHLANGAGIYGMSQYLTNNHTVINGSTDAGYMLDVVGTMRATTSITSPIHLTPNTFVGRSQTTALNQTIVASANTATYRISMATNCKTAVGTTSYQAIVSYTDTSNTTQTIDSSAISCTVLGTTSKFNTIQPANILTGTPITLATTISGSVSYDVAVTVEQITSN